MITTLPENTKGTDYFVGDIHGCYDKLIKELNHIKFDFDKDRLISVGDLTDRGPSSEMCLHLLEESWFHAVRGNHEDMATKVHRGEWQLYNFISNGGVWFEKLPQDRQDKCVSLIEQMPLIIEVPYRGKLIGVLHANVAKRSWNEYHDQLSDHDEDDVMWGRRRIYNNDTTRIDDVDAVVVGHTVVPRVKTLGNVVYIDTGAVFDRHLTVLTTEDVLNRVYQGE